MINFNGLTLVDLPPSAVKQAAQHRQALASTPNRQNFSRTINLSS